MKTLRLPLHQMQSQADVVDLLEREELQPGDKLEVVLDEETKSTLLFAILLLLAAGLLGYFYKQQNKEERVAEGGRILEGLSTSANAETLEREIEAEYGVEIEFIREDDEDEEVDWNRMGMQALAASYGDDEPDYDDLVQESNPDYKPNPQYRPWKPAP